MVRLDVSDGFDVHQYRDGLKLLTQDRESMRLRNEEDLECPACGQPFHRLLVSTKSAITFDDPPSAPFCLARTDERVLVFTHPGTNEDRDRSIPS